MNSQYGGRPGSWALVPMTHVEETYPLIRVGGKKALKKVTARFVFTYSDGQSPPTGPVPPLTVTLQPSTTSLRTSSASLLRDGDSAGDATSSEGNTVSVTAKGLLQSS